MINSLIFPAPYPSYSSQKHMGELIYVPRVLIQRDEYVPCLFLPFFGGSSKIMLFFHGNAEDLGISYEMLDHLRSQLKVNVVAVEYPGYGAYNSKELGFDVSAPNEQ